MATPLWLCHTSLSRKITLSLNMPSFQESYSRSYGSHTPQGGIPLSQSFLVLLGGGRIVHDCLSL